MIRWWRQYTWKVVLLARVLWPVYKLKSRLSVCICELSLWKCVFRWKTRFLFIPLNRFVRRRAKNRSSTECRFRTFVASRLWLDVAWSEMTSWQRFPPCFRIFAKLLALPWRNDSAEQKQGDTRANFQRMRFCKLCKLKAIKNQEFDCE